MKLELCRGGDLVGIGKGDYYLRFVFSNGRIFMHSETYSSKRAALDSARSFIRQASSIVAVEEIT